MQGAWKRRCSAVRKHTVSMADPALSHERGAITSQMGGRSATAVTLNRLSRLFRVSPNLYYSLMDFLTTGGDAAAYRSLGTNCTGVCIWAGGGGGVILSCSSFLAWSVKSARSTLEILSTDSAFADVCVWIHCNSGVTSGRPFDWGCPLVRNACRNGSGGCCHSG